MNDFLVIFVGGCGGLLQGLIIYILAGHSKKLDAVCRDNREDHKELFGKAEDHEHRITVVEGKVRP